MIGLVLAALGAVASPALAAPSIEMDEQVVISSVSPEPSVGSGILAMAIRVTGRLGEEEREYFIFFFEAGQPRPAVGATCDIAFTRFDSEVHFVGEPQSARGGRAIGSFRCNGGEIGGPLG
jgi:hypothetical protein